MFLNMIGISSNLNRTITLNGDVLQWNLNIWYSLLCWNKSLTSSLNTDWMNHKLDKHPITLKLNTKLTVNRKSSNTAPARISNAPIGIPT